MEARINRAKELFMSGYGCCQSVLGAFADIYGLSHEQAMAIAAGFGGGVGRLRMMCVTVSALVILAGLNDGQTWADDRQGKAHCYKVVQDLIAEFKEQNKSIICAELLKLSGNSISKDSMPDKRDKNYYAKRPCVAKVESAARIFANYLKHSKS